MFFHETWPEQWSFGNLFSVSWLINGIIVPAVLAWINVNKNHVFFYMQILASSRQQWPDLEVCLLWTKTYSPKQDKSFPIFVQTDPVPCLRITLCGFLNIWIIPLIQNTHICDYLSFWGNLHQAFSHDLCHRHGNKLSWKHLTAAIHTDKYRRT